MYKFIISLTLLLASGCAGVTVQKYHQSKTYPATIPTSIDVLPQRPSGRTFTELGEITVTGASNWLQIESIFRNKAAEMGADAVYVFSKQEESRQYVFPGDCYMREGYYRPYHRFGPHRYYPRYYYPRGYYYCYGYQPAVQTAVFISAVGIAIKF